jgi:DGQHR domain-containing protein
MNIRKPAGPQLNLTFPLDVTIGAFHIGDYRVPFLTSILKAHQIYDYLNLVTDDPKYAKQDWDIEQLFQREINYERVLEIADNYLHPARADRAPFFNSLTVVLVPKSTGGTFHPPEKSDQYDHFLSIDSIGVTYNQKAENSNYPAGGSFGVLQWNKDEVYGIAIDGQHRLASLKHLWEKDKNAASNLYVSVLFLIIDPSFGFLTPSPGDFNATSVMRSIFIDLNKHSVPVSRARNILLDDLDPMALFVKSLVGPSLAYKKTSEFNSLGFAIGEKGEFNTCLPLDMVDWHSESKSKVDDGPYVTSILGLDWIVQTVLKDCRNPHLSVLDLSKYNPDDAEDGGYYSALKRDFRRWKVFWKEHLEVDMDGNLTNRIDECQEAEKIFNLKGDDLKALHREFSSIWGKPITRLLSTTACYGELCRKRVTEELISPSFGQWYQAKSAKKAAKTPKAQTYFRERLDSIERELKDAAVSIKQYREAVSHINANIKEDRILFYLTTQRSLVHALIALLNEDMLLHWAQDIEMDLENFSDCIYDFGAFYLVEAINKLFSTFSAESSDPGLFKTACQVSEGNRSEVAVDFRKEFWAASLTKPFNPHEMEFSAVAAKRGAKWFVFIAHLHWFLKCNKDKEELSKEWFMEAIDEPSRLDGIPFGHEINKALGSLMEDSGGNIAPMKFLIGSFKENPEDHPDLIKAVTIERVGYLYDLFVDAGCLYDS